MTSSRYIIKADTKLSWCIVRLGQHQSPFIVLPSIDPNTFITDDMPIAHAGIHDQQHFHPRSHDSISIILEHPKHEKNHLCYESKISQKGVELSVEQTCNQLKYIDFEGDFESLPFRHRLVDALKQASRAEAFFHWPFSQPLDFQGFLVNSSPVGLRRFVSTPVGQKSFKSLIIGLKVWNVPHPKSR